MSNIPYITPPQHDKLNGAVSASDDFTIGGIISEAWDKVNGVKGVIIGGLIITSLIYGAISELLLLVLASMGLIMENEFSMIWFITALLLGVLIAMLTYVFSAGMIMLGVRRAANQPVYFKNIFSYLGMMLPLAITALLTTVIISIGFSLFVLPGIYLSIAYSLAIPLVAERGLSPWEAMETSRKAINKCWFRVFGLCLVLSLIVAISAIPMLIGLIWSLPLAIIAMGILYRNLFGVQAMGPSN